MAGPVPLKFAIGVTAGIAVDISLVLCSSQKIVATALNVNLGFAVYGSASISVVIAEVGIQISVGSSLEVSSTIGYSNGTLC